VQKKRILTAKDELTEESENRDDRNLIPPGEDVIQTKIIQYVHMHSLKPVVDAVPSRIYNHLKFSCGEQMVILPRG
jgi:hypothetical protein